MGTSDELTPDLISVNVQLLGNTLLSTPSLYEPSAPLASLPAHPLADGAQPLNQLALDIKALHQQTLSTRASLQQLETQPTSHPYTELLPSDPWVLGVEGVLLVSGALILGALLGRHARPRPTDRAVFTEAGFANRRDYQYGQVQAPLSTPRSAISPLMEPAPAIETEPEWIDCSEPNFEASAWHAGSDLGQEQFISTEQPASSPPEPLASVGDEAAALVSSAAFGGFDPEAAATEVQRVRKSLARKRYVRNRAQVDALTPVTDDASAAVDLALDFVAELNVLSGSDTKPPESYVDQPVSTLSNQPSLAASSGPFTDGIELALHPQVDTNDADAAVRLALAQEFEALGLRQGARELALEITKSSDANLKLQAQTLLASLMHERQHY